MKTFDIDLFNEIASDAEGLLAEIEAMSHTPAEISERHLLKIIRDNETTEYGIKHHFSSIHSYDDFKRLVPISEYGNYNSYIQKMFNNDTAGLLSNYKTAFYAASSGSVGVPKCIPVSTYGMEDLCNYICKLKFAFIKRVLDTNGCRPSWIVCLADFYNDKIKRGNSPSSASSHSDDYISDKIENLYTSPRELQAPSKPIENCIYLKALFALCHRDVSCISAIFSSAINEFFSVIQNNWKSLVNDIRTGHISSLEDSTDERDKALCNALTADPKRADELEEEFARGFDTPILPRIWPNCSLIVAIGGSFFAEYTESSRKYIGDIPYYHNFYGASEAILGACVGLEDTSYVLLAQRNFLEFLPIGESDFSKTLTIDQLEIGKRYEIILTNQSGFYRYRLMDVIEITDFYNRLPKGCISYRYNQVVDMFGEKTNNEHVQYVVHQLSKKLDNQILDFSIYPDYSASQGNYVFFIEPQKDIGKGFHEELRETVDKLLMECNTSYASYRQNGMMGMPQVIALESQSYQLFKELQIMLGTSRNQAKPVRIIDNPKKINFFFGLATGKKTADAMVADYKKHHLQSGKY